MRQETAGGIKADTKRLKVRRANNMKDKTFVANQKEKQNEFLAKNVAEAVKIAFNDALSREVKRGLLEALGFDECCKPLEVRYGTHPEIYLSKYAYHRMNHYET
jgi:hypothetical protein